MEELSLDNILSEDEANTLFLDENALETTSDDTKQKIEEQDKKLSNKESTEIEDPLFEDTSSEEVSSDELEDKTPDSEGSGKTSPSNFYSSIATALRDEGVFPNIEDNDLKDVKSPEDFSNLVQKVVESQLTEKQKRIDVALQVGVEPDYIFKYENTLDILGNISEESLLSDTEDGEILRKQLIYQDYINKGFNKDRAEREVFKSIESGKDKEDAKEALSSSKDYYTTGYNALIEEKQQEAKELIEAREKNLELFKKNIFEQEEVFTGIKLDKNTRQKVYDNITKPIYQDKEGVLYTAIQKYELENKEDFIKKLGVLFTLTDGFKNIEPLIKTKANKAVKSSLRELEHKLANSTNDSYGNITFTSGVSGDNLESNSHFELALD